MKSLLLIFAALVLAFSFSSCRKIQSPTYIRYENFRMEKVGLSNNIVATDIKLFNPNRYPLQIKSASMDIYINESFLGHSSLDSLIVLPATDTASIPLRMQASAKDILSHTAKLLLNPTAKIKITGSAKAGRHGFFINVPIAYEGTQRIDLFSFK